MAISKESIRKGKNKNQEPVSIGVIPDNNPEHRSSPEGFHHHPHPHLTLYNSFEEAKLACELIYLKPGEAHTEFYKTEGVVHCVVAIGNLVPDIGHLYITDTGSTSSIEDQLEELRQQIIWLDKSFKLVKEQVIEFGERLDLVEAIVHLAAEDIVIINASINRIDVDLLGIHEQIEELYRLISEFLPMTDSSIESLFHYDIHTFSLIGYSDGGHIELTDFYDEDRVAECTPPNEFKTYVQGEGVVLTAVPNEGYSFVCWYHNTVGQYETNTAYSFDPSIRCVVNHEEPYNMNVYPTLLNGLEYEIEPNAYVAKFKKMNKLTINIDTDTNDPAVVPHFTNDVVNVWINDVSTKVEHSVYFPDDATIAIQAVPDASGEHRFEQFIIDLYDGEDPIVTKHLNWAHSHIFNDVYIDAYFKEDWMMVTGDSSLPTWGEILSIAGIGKRYIHGSTIDLKAVPKDTYIFDGWSDVNMSDASLEECIVAGDLTTADISLYITRERKEYDLVASFSRTLDAKFYNVGELVYDMHYPKGRVVTTPAEPENPDPIKYGLFNHWNCVTDPAFVLDSSKIMQDLDFDAVWDIKRYSMKFYNVGELAFDLSYEAYETVDTPPEPENPSIAKYDAFTGWICTSDPNFVLEQTPVTAGETFEATWHIREFTVDFQSSETGESIKSVTVPYGTQMGTIKPAGSEVPSVEGKEFKGWLVDDQSVDDTYIITDNTTFTTNYVDIFYNFYQFNIPSSETGNMATKREALKGYLNANIEWVRNIKDRDSLLGTTANLYRYEDYAGSPGFLYVSLELRGTAISLNPQAGRIILEIARDCKIVLAPYIVNITDTLFYGNKANYKKEGDEKEFTLSKISDSSVLSKQSTKDGADVAINAINADSNLLTNILDVKAGDTISIWAQGTTTSRAEIIGVFVKKED